ncbi:hypothetical protein RB620_24620 [Paenibacillus sp. LHD-117]|uniref:hypothetical protein n=1 Tax=Paenibacillus sp. LHD-117 TaxID=3071412 RepID=UPI0027E11C1C|nr:hypothetical protein [Paenibacillus sp. LHD-117]MDQ6422621.1 hypothetical protein [Paenibacillus sp. LHD-117]
MNGKAGDMGLDLEEKAFIETQTERIGSSIPILNNDDRALIYHVLAEVYRKGCTIKGRGEGNLHT